MPALARSLEIFFVALRLGLTSFGGPVAHLGYFRAEYVARRRWLGEAEYADLVALCQFLPGPASSQVGFGIGLHRGGLPGGLLAFLGFTLPSLALMIGFALGLAALPAAAAGPYVQGMKIAAVAVVAHAVWGMGQKLCADRPTQSLALVTAAILCLLADPRLQVGLILAGAVFGALFLPADPADTPAPPARVGGLPKLALLVFVLLLLGLPLLEGQGSAWQVFSSCYRSGSLVFGGGHVVLPLLEQEFVPGLLDAETFLAGYGAVQAVPGPLFTFAAFLGAVGREGSEAWLYGLWASLGIFLPSFLLLYGVLPHWQNLRRRPRVQAGLRGTNAVVVGLLLAALYRPVFTAGIGDAAHFALGLACFLALQTWRWPAWAVVILAALAAGLGIG